jgi:excisionase family DNA binding protein
MSEEKLLLTVDEVAAMTGFSSGTLRHWVSEKRIRFLRISTRCVRFRRSDIEAWLAEKVVAPEVPELTRRKTKIR